MENLKIYNAVRVVPDTAKKAITGGRLKGKSDINPMWRIKILTETFGAAGFGWYYDITNQWKEVMANGEVLAFCNINLFVKVDNEWSKPIPGTGGNKMSDMESKGLYNSDECYKMALTDAISVACKALGVGASVYWELDNTKYTKHSEAQTPPPQPQPVPPKTFDAIITKLNSGALDNGATPKSIEAYLKQFLPLTSAQQETFDLAVETFKTKQANATT